ncbi:MAG: phosphoribosyltransferase family protein [Acidimicrobiales bacterium]|jgi:hypoxanthine phosphoribosyltransferase|nr:phosphoribosyltransferase family protein [Acidimicrobiales bacterium]
MASTTPPGLEVILDQAEIDDVVARLAAEISETSSGGVVLAAVLRGSVPFLSDLVRAMTVRPIIDFLAITPYAPNTGRVRLLKDLDIDIAGREVLIIEDIVDTGLTTAFIHGELSRRNPARIGVCAFVDRPARRVVPVELDHVGVQIPDQFVVGYGLDHEGRYRNARVLATADPAVLAEDPDAYVEALYPA